MGSSAAGWCRQQTIIIRNVCEESTRPIFRWLWQGGGATRDNWHELLLIGNSNAEPQHWKNVKQGDFFVYFLVNWYFPDLNFEPSYSGIEQNFVILHGSSLKSRNIQLYGPTFFLYNSEEVCVCTIESPYLVKTQKLNILFREKWRNATTAVYEQRTRLS